MKLGDNPSRTMSSPSARKVARTNRGRRSNLQPFPKYQNPVVETDPDKRDDQSQGVIVWSEKCPLDEGIPEGYIDTIIRGFGQNADLFHDVLQAKPDADLQHLRTCYFRTGREFLIGAGVHGYHELSDGNHLSNMAKTRFEAVSMAFQILSKPEWREEYMRNGLQTARERRTEPSTTNAFGGRSVWWNEEVEELIFESEPCEKAQDEDIPDGRRRKNKKHKPKVFIEQGDAELDEHLARLDAEAETHFKRDFFDTLEESLDGILKFRKEKGGKQKETNEQEKKDSGESKSNEGDGDNSLTGESNGDSKQMGADDEVSFVGMLASRLMGTGSVSSKGSGNRAPAATLIPLSKNEANEPFRCVSPEPLLTGSEEGEDHEARHALSQGSQKDKESLNQDDNLFESDGFFADFDNQSGKDVSSIAVPNVRSSSPTTMSVVSDLSESLATTHSQMTRSTTHTNKSSTDQIMATKVQVHTITPEVIQGVFEDVEPDEEFFEDTCFKSTQHIARSLSNFGERRSAGKSDGNLITPEKSEVASNSTKHTTNEEDVEGFTKILASYFQEMADFEVDWKKAIFGVFDEGIENLTKVISDEVKKTPKLKAKDAVQSSAEFAIETARSFS